MSAYFVFDLFLQDEDGVAVTPGIPDTVLKQWPDKEELKKFQEEMVEIYGAIDQATPSPPNKRPASQIDQQSSSKRGRLVGPDKICRIEDLKGEEQHKVGIWIYLYRYSLSYFRYSIIKITRWDMVFNLDPGSGGGAEHPNYIRPSLFDNSQCLSGCTGEWWRLFCILALVWTLNF